MLAKEMFEALGYEYFKLENCIHCYNKEEDDHIWIYLDAGTISFKYNPNREVFQAIGQQFKELGWNK